MGTHVIIVEIDENKHDRYDCECENKRMMVISKDLEHRPVVFIRFNPDGYIDYNNFKIQTPWITNKLGFLVIKNTEEWNSRIETLLETIKYWTDNISEKTIEIVQLFY